MKILVLSNLYPPDFVGGYEVACQHVVEALRSRGHDVRVLTAVPRVPTVDPAYVLRRFRVREVFDEHFERLNHHLTLRMELAAARLVDSHNTYVLISELERFAPDVVYLCNLDGLGGLGLVGCLEYLKVPWVWQLGDSNPPWMCSTWRGIVPQLTREFERQCRGHFIVVSQCLQEEIADLGVRLGGHVEIIPNWVSGAHPGPRDSYYRGGHLRIASAGAIARHKGVHILVDAAKLLIEAGYDNFSVDIYGKTQDESIVRSVRELQDDRVRVMGPRSHAEVARLLTEYDVFAFPTWEREPFGMAPLEAAAAGCVPIITHVCGIAEWWVDRVHCIKIERTPEALTAALREILDGDLEVEPLARRTAAIARRDFHLDRVILKIEAVLGRAARTDRADGGHGAGSPADAYRLASLADRVTRTLIQEEFGRH
jgi:glycosyltransferase involved in cell wall biosynthesis